MSEPLKRTPRRRIIGLVTSTKMAKTIVVHSDRTVQHPEFKKYMKRTTAYKAHDEKGDAQVGDRVEIMETRPLSKTKCFRLVRIIDRARIPVTTPALAADIDPAVSGTKKSGIAPHPKRSRAES